MSHAIGSIWSIKSTQPDNSQDVVVVVSGLKQHENTAFYRVQPISTQIDMATANDVVISDTSILGSPFLIEAWNEQPIHEKLLEQQLGILSPEVLESIVPTPISLSLEQKIFRKNEIQRTAYLRDSVYEELEEIFESKEDVQVIPLWGKITLLKIAASFLLLSVALAYTSYQLGWLEPLLSKKEEKTTPTEKKLDMEEETKSKLELFTPKQTVRFYSGYDSEIEGGLGTTFRLSSFSLVTPYRQIIQDTVYMDIIEVYNPMGLTNLFEGSEIPVSRIEKAFFVAPFYEKGVILFSDFDPPQLLYSDTGRFTMYYGGPSSEMVDWEEIEDDPLTFIEKPTRIMEEYEKFVESSKFLDSIQVHYYLDGTQYKPQKGSGLAYEKSFVENRNNYVSNYRQNIHFKAVVAKAEAQWKLYQEQRTLTIQGLPNPKEIRFQLLKPGWYAIVKN